MRHLSLAFALIAFLMTACEEPNFTPKPRGYPRVVLPQKGYRPFDTTFCQFSFDYPVYADIERDTVFFDEKPPSDCWFNIKIPNLNAEIHCSYYAIAGANSLQKLNNDAFTLANKHSIKADYIDNQSFKNAYGASGFIFNIEGPAASPMQFYVTDSSKHFLRGALYFNTQARPDSLAPMTAFVKEDIMKMLMTFQWRK